MGAEEDRIPIDPSGRPDLSYYTQSAEYYAAMHARAIAPGGTFAERTHGSWGLIAKGNEAIPHALAMLANAKPDAREDGAGILAEIGKGEGVVQSVLVALAGETAYKRATASSRRLAPCATAPRFPRSRH